MSENTSTNDTSAVPEATPSSGDGAPSIGDTLRAQFAKLDKAGGAREEEGSPGKDESGVSRPAGEGDESRQPETTGGENERQDATPSGQQRASRAPQSLPPALREAWGTLKPDAQDALLKREGEINNALRSSAKEREFARQVQSVFQPYADKITEHPLKVMENLLQSADRLQHGSEAEQVEMIALMIDGFKVPIDLLAQRLESGQPLRAARPDPRVAALERRLDAEDQRRVSERYNSDRELLNNFAKDKVHLDRVAAHMAALIDDATDRGVAFDLDDIYDRACWSDPEIRKQLQSQQQAQGTATAATQRARNAGSSVKTNPAHAGGKKGNLSIRELLEEKYSR